MKILKYCGDWDTKEIAKWLSQHSYNHYFFLKNNTSNLFRYWENDMTTWKNNPDNCLVTVETKGEIVGMASFISLPWDSQIFGIKMAKIGHIFSKEFSYHEKLAIKRELLNFIVDYAISRGVWHLSCKLDTDDFSSIHVLEDSGFQLMDAIVTYLFLKNKKKSSLPRGFYKTRYAQEKDFSALVCLAERSFKADRFHTDPSLSWEKANNLYINWVKNYLENKALCKVIVAENRNKDPVGFLAYKLNKLILETTGDKIIGEGLSAVSPEAKGAYISLVKSTIQDVISFYDYAEFDTQINNYEVIKVWQRFGFTFIKARYTFHRYLEDDKRYRA